MNKKNLNIIYIKYHSERGASGGAKIIYRHSDLINKLSIMVTLLQKCCILKKVKLVNGPTSYKKKIKN